MLCGYFLVLLIFNAQSKDVSEDKQEFCDTLECDDSSEEIVCGMRREGDGFRLRVFQNECDLLRYGCQVVEEKEAYGLTVIDYCKKTFPEYFQNLQISTPEPILSKKSLNQPHIFTSFIDYCSLDCSDVNKKENVCGIRKYGAGFKVRLFLNKCELTKYNCVNHLAFNETNFHICNGMSLHDENKTERNVNRKGKGTTDPIMNSLIYSDTRDVTESTPSDNLEMTSKINQKNIIVLDESMLDFTGDINDTMDNFFAGTHVFDLPVRDISKDLNETARRMMMKIAGPVTVFRPWIKIPKNISDDVWHEPTLSSCYHTCPTSCPDTYTPVCGVPGIVAREPSIMFKNHCYMDVAQCKMRWEDKSETAISSSYIESSFLICLGNALNGLYRFLPLVRTLQHMGRLKKHGKFHYKLRNMRFFNNLLNREPKIMG